jgi:hypothetical protein
MRYKNTVWFVTPLKKRQAMLQVCHMVYHEVKGRVLNMQHSKIKEAVELKLNEIKLTVKNAFKQGRIHNML